MKSFTEIPPEDLTLNPFTKIGNEWMLVTAGTAYNWNTMTASWGGLGVIWHKNVSFVFVRHSRYTYDFMEKNGFYSLSFFSPEYRDTLSYCGSHSGRDVDKAAETGLVPFTPAPGTVSFQQAELILVCKKLYAGGIDPEDFIDPSVLNNYPAKDYHKTYIGQINRVLYKAE